MSDLVINGQTYSGIEVLKMTDTSHNQVLFAPSTLGAININDYIEGKVIPSVYINNTITKLKPYAFHARNASYDGHQSVYLPNCTEIGEFAFQGLAYVSGNITTIYAPKASIIGSNAFISTVLTSAFFPECTSLGNGAFMGCSKLSEVYLPKVPVIYGGTFSRCINLQSISLPCCSEIYASAFYSCVNLSIVTLPSINCLYSSTFYECKKLSSIYLYANSGRLNIYTSAFFSCISLRYLYILHSEVAILSSMSAFNNTPLYNYSPRGSIFVPQSLVSAYQTANIWSAYGFPSLFVGLTDAEVSEIKAQMGVS